MDGRILRCNIISSCQSAATPEIVKTLLSTSLSHLRSAIASTGLCRLPVAVVLLDMLSYFVVADLLLALHLDAGAVPSTLTVSVEQCTNIWDRLLAIYQRRGLY